MEQGRSSLATIFLVVAVVVLNSSSCNAARGVLSLDSLTFDKVLTAHDYVLVKFDKAFAAGESEDKFNAFALLAARQKQLLIASVAVAQYGARDNEDLAKRYKITTEDYPRIKLFLHQQDSIAETYPGNVTADGLVAFVRKHTALYIGLSGCLEAFDRLAERSLQVASPNAVSFVKEAQHLKAELVDEKEIASANVYIKIMKLVTDRGERFPQNEVSRVKRLLQTKLSEDKKKELELRLNILQSFLPQEEVHNAAKEEL